MFLLILLASFDHEAILGGVILTTPVVIVLLIIRYLARRARRHVAPQLEETDS